MTEKRAPNFLANEKSPYLQEHAHNPVQWRPWGDEALRKAKNDGKPILLSIGYSTCHWCHVMARESFEDPETAAIINRHFIPIKVDREERPEIDSYYMAAVQSMIGSGGWPLNVFLTPDLKPFYGGTYFPPEPRFGSPSFKQVLEFVAKLWRERKAEALESSDLVAKALATKAKRAGEVNQGLIDGCYSALVSSFDPEHGGFGTAPKFPLPVDIGFLLRYNHRTGEGLAMTAATRSLDAMMSGGIRDHVGGGFHRYSTDRVWLVPHFEKMLYDNALLAKVYLEAHQATGEAAYAGVAKETFGWMEREMTDERGGLYSAQDADTGDGEGFYYTWTPDEVGAALGGDAEAFCSRYGVTRTGNFEGRSILHVSMAGTAEEDPSVSKWKRSLLRERMKRRRPATDKKVLTSWNGLAVSALAFGGAVLDDAELTGRAARAADFVLSTNSRRGRLLRMSVGGEAALEGTLDDYSFFVQGLLDLFDATSEEKWLAEARRLTAEMVDLFSEGEDPGFRLTQRGQQFRVEDDYDGPTPSGNSVAISDMVRLSSITGDPALKRRASAALESFGGAIEEQPSGHAMMATALDLALNGTKEVVVSARSAEAAKPLLKAARSVYAPDASLVVATQATYDGLARLSPLLEGRDPKAKPMAYVCENFTCKLPVTSPDALKEQLRGRRK